MRASSAAAAWTVAFVLFACTGDEPVARKSDDGGATVTPTDASTPADASAPLDASAPRDAGADAARPSFTCGAGACAADQMCCTSTTAFLYPDDTACEARAGGCKGGGGIVGCTSSASCVGGAVCCAFRRLDDGGAPPEFTRVDCVAPTSCAAPAIVLCDLTAPVCASGTCIAGEDARYGYCK